jgi:hypothetical protein
LCGGCAFCPPDDCGGTPGYSELVELGIENGSGFDPARSDVDEANRRLDATVGALSHAA